MARRSLRIQEKAKTSTDLQMQDLSETEISNAVGSEFEEDDLKEEDEDERPRKRAKKDTRSKRSSVDEDYRVSSSSKKRRMPEQFRKVKGKLGLLEKLAKDVPLDVILEIFCYLDPGDLLRLARTTKDLRGILMSKSSKNIWRTARKSVEGLPSLPDDLNEPQYAHLLYESYCHVCGHKPCNNVYWSFRMRCCKSCASESFITIDDPALIAKLPPGLREERQKVLPCESMQVARCRYIVTHHGIVARLKAEYEALQTSWEQYGWIRIKTVKRLGKQAHGRQCQEWLQDRLDQRSDELYEIREQRKEAILERLEKIGWREEAEISMRDGQDFTNHKLVRQSKKLTDYGWKNIKTELVQWLTEERRSRIERHRFRLLALLSAEYNNIKYSRDLRDPFPGKADILNDEYFEGLVWDTPVDEEITSDLMKSKLLEHLPRIIDQWKPKKLQELVEIMQKTHPEATISGLQLATTVFECSKCCNLPLVYPQMFYHHCCFENPDANSIRIKLLDYSSTGPWTSRYLTLSEKYPTRVKTVIEACSLDPMTTTVQDLWDANPLIECTDCERQSPAWNAGRLFMRWPAAITYVDHHNHTHKINAFGDETQKILASDRSFGFDLLRCAHCHGALVNSIMTLISHFKSAHSDIFSEDELDSTRFTRLEDVQEHWYWNPTCSLQGWSNEFRYKVAPVPTVVDSGSDSQGSSPS
ncbi:hypothetical protein GYMLUDRAFT_44820 [Collybiopsis luxurians FD-317 M1]|uniref:F-box domain-containing protein n=1 Tax=Collybiopsis luxurians FD-317 M1 TaxID=944289 RepID=A0A0D0C9D8_9AGAR|nr:hypothetical protein GYMLUDRAFT_44820 [Collybiopsis luxurians FD-317 M1]